MGNPGSKQKKPKFRAIKNHYESLAEVQDALRQSGLESSNLIVGVDFTESNETSGEKTFGGRPLHEISAERLNPYQEVIQIVGKTLEKFDDDHLIPAYGFGDKTTKDKSVFPFIPDRPCNGFEEVLTRYNAIASTIIPSGPTSFAPLIREAIRIVRETRAYHILIIIADGQVNAVKETSDAIVEATNYPLSIITVGVGDGPWEVMEEFDDQLPKRKFDNFQFVPFHDTMEKAENREVTFSVAALMEIPEQFKLIKQLGLLG